MEILFYSLALVKLKKIATKSATACIDKKFSSRHAQNNSVKKHYNIVKYSNNQKLVLFLDIIILMKRFITILLLNGIVFLANAKNLVQFSGFVRDAESSSPVPFCAIYIEGVNRGAITSLEGFFTFPAAKGDTILVKALGYKTFTVIIPADLELSSFTKEITLERNPIELPTTTIHAPLPTENELRWAMINLDVPNNMQELAQQTIEQSILTDEISRNMNFNGKENFNQYVQNQVGYYYNQNGGQHPGISLTNPFAWANFIKDIKAKKKKKNK